MSPQVGKPEGDPEVGNIKNFLRFSLYNFHLIPIYSHRNTAGDMPAKCSTFLRNTWNAVKHAHYQYVLF